MEAVEDLGQRQGTHPRGGELDRQRQPVKARTDLGHRGSVVVADGEVRAGAAGPIGEQCGGFIGQRQ